ncbi:MAG: hypothetical protein KI791_13865 [Cyclobacteriaceae bacterium]|nr:hypothetical protein [Cyclobacteriaceae bacterium SS2]
MDAKITLSFEKEVIEKAKQYADAQNISLSRLTEYLYRQITSNQYQSLEEWPIADWVSQVSEGAAEYRTKSQSRKDLKQAFFNNKK